MHAPTLDQVLSTPTLPSLPKVAMEVIELAADPDANVNDIAKVIQYDQALASKILRTVNSSLYGLSKPCPTISRAVAYLGLNTVKSIVLSFSLTEMTRSPAIGGFDLQDYWRRCVYAATASRRLARHVGGCDSEEVFVAALMQDIGMLAIHAAARDTYQQVIANAGDHAQLPRAESSSLHYTHADAGARLAAKWNLPGQIIEPIRLHHAGKVDDAEQGKLVNLVRMGLQLARVLAFNGGPEELRTLRSLGASQFEIDPETMNGIVHEAAADAREVSRLLEVKTGGHPDAQAILAAADEMRIAHTLQVQRETNSLREENQQFYEQSITDALTGVSNRGHFDRQLAELLRSAAAFKTHLALILVDADHFKSLNDTHGHPAGDAVLVELARRLVATIGDHGHVFRYGGEEFAVLMPGTDRIVAARTAETIRQSVGGTPFDLGEVTCDVDEVPVTISLGVAAASPDFAATYQKPALLIQAADKALYAAKSAGRDRVCVFKPRVAA